MKIFFVLILSIFCQLNTFAYDPRLEIPEIDACVGYLKTQLPSFDVEESSLIASCKNVDLDCVKQASNSLSSAERVSKGTLVSLAQLCQGKGTGKCLGKVLETVPSYDRDTFSELKALLTKCQ